MTVRPLSTAIKCLDLIDVLVTLDEPARLSHIARACTESRATTYQRLLTLMTAGWVERLNDDTYRLSLKACRVSSAALDQAGFGERALPVLQQLTQETGETSSLVTVESGLLVIAQRVEAQGVLRADLRVGAELSFEESASGRVWRAFGDIDRVDNGNTFDDQSRVPFDRLAILKAGYATGGGGRTLPGIAVIAAPVFGQTGACLASLSLVGPESRFNADALLSPLLAAADELAGLLTGTTTMRSAAE